METIEEAVEFMGSEDPVSDDRLIFSGFKNADHVEGLSGDILGIDFGLPVHDFFGTE